MVASYYYLDYKTTQRAALEGDDLDASLDGTQVLDEPRAIAFLVDAEEFAELPVRHNEDGLNSDLATALFQGRDEAAIFDAVEDRGFDDPHAKAALLVHAKLRDEPLPIADYATDTRSVFEQTSRVLAALIDVAADAGNLKLTLALCRLSQALNTACAAKRDELAQLPGVSDADAKELRKALRLGRDRGLAHLPKVDLRRALHQIGASKDVAHRAARFADALPTGRTSLSADLKTTDGGKLDSVACDEEFRCDVVLNVPPPKKRAKHDRRLAFGFWLVLADGDELVALKRVTCHGARVDATLAVAGPDEVLDDWTLTLYAVADAARGFDADVLTLPALTVVAAGDDG